MSGPLAMPAAIDRIFVSMTQQWDLETYVDSYLSSRRIARTHANRERVWDCVIEFRGRAPYMKSDLDFFLDAHLDRAQPGATHSHS